MVSSKRRLYGIVSLAVVICLLGGELAIRFIGMKKDRNKNLII